MLRSVIAAGLTAAVLALTAAPALAGPAETAFLQKLTANWTGRGKLTGAQSGAVACRLVISGGGQSVKYQGRCTIPDMATQAFNGAISYNDKAKRYEATSKGQVSVGAKSGSGVTFVLNLKDPMIGTGTSTLKIGASQIVTDTTINRTGPQAGSYTAHVVLTK